METQNAVCLFVQVWVAGRVLLLLVGTLCFTPYTAVFSLQTELTKKMARGSRDDAVLLFDAVDSLLKERLYHSAEIVGGILLSRTSMPSQQSQREGGLHAEALSMFADALKGRGEHKRATVRKGFRCCK